MVISRSIARLVIDIDTTAISGNTKSILKLQRVSHQTNLRHQKCRRKFVCPDFVLAALKFDVNSIDINNGLADQSIVFDLSDK
jgi:hypothetical protein